MTNSPPWHDEDLRVASDQHWRAKYRLLQSWYREEVLKEEPDIGSNGRRIGNMLSADAGAKGRNFLTPEVAAYVDQRIPEVQEANGTIEVTRLRRNMLSSMPLCFNLFGHLRQHPAEAAALMKEAFDLDVAEVVKIDVEWAPHPHPLSDRTAFDAFVEYRTTIARNRISSVRSKAARWARFSSPASWTSPKIR